MDLKKEWLYSTNVYEVNLRQYTEEGSFTAFATHLPRLKDMGVQALWFMPLTPIAQKNKKGKMGSYYACSDYCAINPEFGTEDEWLSLVNKMHSMGFKVIIDWVANHTGWDHVWTIEHPGYYKKEATGAFKIASGMDDIIELDFENRALRQAMIDAMIYWIRKYDIDGFRCDLASWVAVDFWVEAKQKIDLIKPLFWLAEADALENPEYMQVFDAAYTWKWMHSTKEFYEKKTDFRHLISLLHQYRQAPGLPAWFTSNHDENSWNGTETEKYGAMANMLAVFSCCIPGIPLLYSGQEIPNLKRLEFFEKDNINWKWEIKLHGFFKTLLDFRNHPALHAMASFERMHSSADDRLLVFLRKYKEHEALVILNFTGQSQRVELFDERIQGDFNSLFGPSSFHAASRITLLEAYGYAVYFK
jgi:glycosidase